MCLLGAVVCICAMFLNNSLPSFPVTFLSFPAHFLPQTIKDIAFHPVPLGKWGQQGLSEKLGTTSLETVYSVLSLLSAVSDLTYFVQTPHVVL